MENRATEASKAEVAIKAVAGTKGLSTTAAGVLHEGLC